MTRRSRLVGALLALMFLLVACGDDDSAHSDHQGDSGVSRIEVTDAVVVLPAGANSAIYFTITNSGDAADRLVGARTDIGETMLHETREEGGLMSMHHVTEVEVGPGQTVQFRPGGLHVMIHDVEPLAEGDVIGVELEFAKAGTVAVEAVVRTADQLIDG